MTPRRFRRARDKIGVTHYRHVEARGPICARSYDHWLLTSPGPGGELRDTRDVPTCFECLAIAADWGLV